MDKVKQYIYYILIGILSFLSLAFLPLIGGSSGSMGWGFPETTAAWTIWIASRLSCSCLNVLIFHCFVRQGDFNTKNNENRKKAEEMLGRNKKKEHKPLSPRQFFGREYGRKIPSVFLFSLLSLIAFGPILLVFNVAAFLSYLFTVLMSLVFGILEMKKVEAYYTEDLLKYAAYMELVSRESQEGSDEDAGV